MKIGQTNKDRTRCGERERGQEIENKHTHIHIQCKDRKYKQTKQHSWIVRVRVNVCILFSNSTYITGTLVRTNTKTRTHIWTHTYTHTLTLTHIVDLKMRMPLTFQHKTRFNSCFIHIFLFCLRCSVFDMQLVYTHFCFVYFRRWLLIDSIAHFS